MIITKKSLKLKLFSCSI